MSKSKPFSLSAMVDTDGEGNMTDESATTPRGANKENSGPEIKKRGGRPKANAKRFTKPKRLSTESVASVKEDSKKPKAGRKKAPLATRDPNEVGDADEADEIAQLDSAPVTKDRTKSKPGNKRKALEEPVDRPTKSRATNKNAVQKTDGEFQYTPTHGARSERHPGTKLANLSSPSGAVQDVGQEIPETQEDILPDPSLSVDDEEDGSAKMSAFVRRRRNDEIQGPLHARQPAALRKGLKSPSKAEQSTGDPALRRKLGEMTRKYDTMNLRYRELREVGIKEAEVNYDKLKKQTEVNRKAAADLIESLKKEISTQKAIAQESHSLRSQLQDRKADLAEAKKAADDLSRTVTELQNENKVLQVKLASSRGTSVPAERTPGSAMRSKIGPSKPGSMSVLDSATAQLKDDLYSDLTGLILRGVEVEAEADIFDCIQTGRNGTLHFKLAVTKDPDEAYEDVEFQYTPRLDSSRDSALIELLPEYLTEEITFSRINAAPFYARIMDTLMRKRVIEAGE